MLFKELSVFAIISGLVVNALPGLEARTTTSKALSTPAVIGNFQYLGCRSDNVTKRTLAAKKIQSNAMSIELCASKCASYAYFGVEYATQCFCGNKLASGSSFVTDGRCKMACKGDTAEGCGGRIGLLLYQNPAHVSTTTKHSTASSTTASTTTTVSTTASTTTTAPTTTAPTTTTTTAPTTTTTAPTTTTTTAPTTTTTTAPTTTTTAPTTTTTAPTTTTTTAPTTTTTTAPTTTTTAPTTTTTTAPTTTTTTAPTTTTTTAPTTTTTAPTTTTTASTTTVSPSVSGYAAQGCYNDTTQARGLIGPAYIGSMVDLETCASYCTGYSYFSVENGKDCFCGNTLQSTSVLNPSSKCSSPCINNSTEICGAFDYMNLYYNPQPGPLPTFNGFTYQGCYKDNTTARVLTGKSTIGSTVSVDTCATFCSGFQYFGVENANNCFCGNTTQGSLTPSFACQNNCAGNVNQTCGGSGAINIYVS